MTKSSYVALKFVGFSLKNQNEKNEFGYLYLINETVTSLLHILQISVK